MTKVTLQQVQEDLLGCLRRVERGETLLVVHDSQPVAEIKPVGSQPSQRRPTGLAAGQFVVPKDFDAPLPGEVLGDFEGA